MADTLSSRDAKSPKQLVEDGDLAGSLTADGIERNATQNAVAGHYVVAEPIAGALRARDANGVGFDYEENGQLVVEVDEDLAPTLRVGGRDNPGHRAGDGADNTPLVVDAILDPDAASGRDGVALTPSADAEGRQRLRNASLGVQEGDGASPTLNATAPPAVAIHEGVDYARVMSVRGREGGAQAELEADDVAPSLRAGDGGSSRGLHAYVEGPTVFRRSHKANDPEDPDHWQEAEVADTLAGPVGDQHAAQLVADRSPTVSGHQIDAVHTSDGLADPLSTSLGTGVQKVLEGAPVAPTLRSGGHGDPGIGRDGDEDRLVLEDPNAGVSGTLLAAGSRAAPVDGRRQDGSRTDAIPLALVDGPPGEDREQANSLKAQGDRWHADGSDNFAAHVDVAPTLNSNATGGHRQDADQAEAMVTGAPAGEEEPDDPMLPRKLDSHRYRVVGNGVVAPVAEFLGLRIAAEVARSTPP